MFTSKRCDRFQYSAASVTLPCRLSTLPGTFGNGIAFSIFNATGSIMDEGIVLLANAGRTTRPAASSDDEKGL